MKKLLLTLLCLITASAFLHAEEVTYTYTITSSATFGTATGTKFSKTAQLGDASWTLASDNMQYLNFTSSCVQIGSNGKATSFSLSTNDFADYTVKSVTYKGAAYSSNHTVSVKVGDTPFTSGGQESVSLSKWTTVGNHTFTGSAQGEIVIEVTAGSSARAAYLQSITVVYETVSKPTPPYQPYFVYDSNLESINDGDIIAEGTVINAMSDTDSSETIITVNGVDYANGYTVNYGEATELTLTASSTVTVDGLTSDPATATITINKPDIPTPVITVTPDPTEPQLKGTQVTVSVTLDGEPYEDFIVEGDILTFDNGDTHKVSVLCDDGTERTFTYTWASLPAPTSTQGGLGDSVTITCEDATSLYIVATTDNGNEAEYIVDGNSFDLRLLDSTNAIVEVLAEAYKENYKSSSEVFTYTISQPLPTEAYYDANIYELVTSFDNIDLTGERAYVATATPATNPSCSYIMAPRGTNSYFTGNALKAIVDNETEIDITGYTYQPFYFAASSTEGKYNLYTISGNTKEYFQPNSTSTSMNFGSSPLDCGFTFSDSDNTANISNGSRTLRMNTSASNRFSCYNTSDKNYRPTTIWGQKYHAATPVADMQVIASVGMAGKEVNAVTGTTVELKAYDKAFNVIEGARLYYAFKGDEAADYLRDFKLYEGPVTINESCALMVFAVADGYYTCSPEEYFFTYNVSDFEYSVVGAGHEFAEPQYVDMTVTDGNDNTYVRHAFANYYIITAKDADGNIWAKTSTRGADGNYKAVMVNGDDETVKIGITAEPVAEYALIKGDAEGTYALFLPGSVTSWSEDVLAEDAKAEWLAAGSYLHHNHFAHAEEAAPAEARRRAADSNEPVYMTLSSEGISLKDGGHDLTFNPDTKEFVCACTGAASAQPIILAASTADADGNGGLNTGVESVDAADTELPAVYYNLQGIRVERPVHGNFYIEVRGTKTAKVRF